MKTGDVVRLKSGGPMMTVVHDAVIRVTEAPESTETITALQAYVCVWFDGNVSIQGVFAADTIQEVSR